MKKIRMLQVKKGTRKEKGVKKKKIALPSIRGTMPIYTPLVDSIIE